MVFIKMAGLEPWLADRIDLAEELFDRNLKSRIGRDGQTDGGILKREFAFDASAIGLESRNVKVQAAFVSDISDKVKSEYYGWMQDYPGGSGDSQCNGGMICVASYGGEDYDREYHRETFVHEMLHGFDMLENRYSKSSDFGRKHRDVPRSENNGIPYPGMPGPFGELPETDSHYADAFTCRAEINEYIYDLSVFIGKFSKGRDRGECIDMIKDALKRKEAFLKFYDDVKYRYNASSLLTLYHLAFSKRRRQEAIDILDSMK